MVSADVRWPEPNDRDAKFARQVDIGRTADSGSAPDALCLLSLDGSPAVCVRLWQTSEELYTFRDAVYWRGLFVIGWGDAFYVIDPDTDSHTRHGLGACFGCLHAGDALLVASAERVIRVRPDGTVAWISEPIGLDGVTISAVDASFIEGSGEWDPPGGWKPYRLRLTDGAVIPGGES